MLMFWQNIGGSEKCPKGPHITSAGLLRSTCQSFTAVQCTWALCIFYKVPSRGVEIHWKESIINWGILSRSFRCDLWNIDFFNFINGTFLTTHTYHFKVCRRLFLVIFKWEGIWIGGKYIIVWSVGAKEISKINNKH